MAAPTGTGVYCGAAALLISFAQAFVKSIHFTHRPVVHRNGGDNVNLVGGMLDAVQDCLRQWAVITSRLVIPSTVMVREQKIVEDFCLRACSSSKMSCCLVSIDFGSSYSLMMSRTGLVYFASTFL